MLYECHQEEPKHRSKQTLVSEIPSILQSGKASDVSITIQHKQVEIMRKQIHEEAINSYDEESINRDQNYVESPTEPWYCIRALCICLY
jgi:uncharacterized protein YacL (UPF0231 family)